MAARLKATVLDCPDPQALAAFYSALLGLPITRDDHDWVDVGPPDGWHLSFQQVRDHRPPQWPDPTHPQQFHLDIRVDDIEAEEQRALGLGAVPLSSAAPGFRVYADPAGHPFCLEYADPVMPPA
jgi:catechol 2,3-dioxygenase-like lactoylglutathione lyase family enzyme